jgi:hypothetical protein
MLRMRVLRAPSSQRVRAIGRSNHRYSGAHLKPTARADCTTHTPVDVIPVTYVTRRRARPIAALPTQPAILPRSGHWFITHALVVHTNRTAASVASTWRQQATMADVRQGPGQCYRRRRLGAVGLKCTCIPGSIDSLSLNENDRSLLVVSSLACHRPAGPVYAHTAAFGQRVLAKISPVITDIPGTLQVNYRASRFGALRRVLTAE